MNVVLVEPEIPPNTGNVARLCAATQSTLHLVGPLGFRLDDKTLKRAGMDYWEQVTWKCWESLEQLQAAARREPRPPVFYYVTTKSKRPYTQPQYRADDYLVFGRETAGLPKVLLDANPETTITIPMFNPQARSLNLATAVAIVLSHTIWQIKSVDGTWPE
ncbi:MAG TPA: tRNA (cytidine(34)-2'-O)-methyltransferase [Verrucomicrobiae bacterium]|nr:tRNA (cytidine(34)-2'-O)-methyltransferase [Verrucomicrobiae bacterium]